GRPPLACGPPRSACGPRGSSAAPGAFPPRRGPPRRTAPRPPPGSRRPQTGRCRRRSAGAGPCPPARRPGPPSRTPGACGGARSSGPTAPTCRAAPPESCPRSGRGPPRGSHPGRPRTPPAPPRHLGVRPGAVGQHHPVSAGVVLKEIEDPLVLHEPAGEVEVRLPVLDTEVARVKGPLEIEGDVQPPQHLLQDVRHRQVLKDAALSPQGQPPELGHQFEPVGGERAVARALGEVTADAVEIPPVAPWGLQR